MSSGNMEIGMIKWAFGFDYARGKKNDYGYIKSKTTFHEPKFWINNVEQDSSLWDKYRRKGEDSRIEDEYVVYEEYADFQSSSGYGAKHVRLLKEVSKEYLLDNLKQGLINQPVIQSVLIDTHPDIYLKNKMKDYFPYIDQPKIRKLFVEKLQSGCFKENTSSALAEYIKKKKGITWPSEYWLYFDFSQEKTDDMLKLYQTASEKGIDVNLLYSIIPQIWINNKDIIQDVPFPTIKQYYGCHKMSHEEFAFLMKSRKDNDEREWIAGKAERPWLFDSKELFCFLKERDLIEYIHTIDFLNENKSYRQKMSNVFHCLDPLVVENAAKELVCVAKEKADSSWDQYLPEWVLDPQKMPVDFYPEMESGEESIVETNSSEEEYCRQDYIDEPEFVEYRQRYGLDTKLSVDQRRAVQSIKGAYLLFAIPGSGKTTVIIHRLAYMIYGKGITDQILCMTFARDAATHMEREYKKLTRTMRRKEITNEPKFNTIHGLCREIINLYFKMNKNHNLKCPELIEDKDRTPKENRPRTILRYVVDTILIEINKSNNNSESQSGNNKNSDEKDELTEKIANAYQYICCRCIYKDAEKIKKMKVETDGNTYDVKPFYEKYLSELRKKGLMDHTRCLVLAYEFLSGDKSLLEKVRDEYKYICVDEAQDVSTIQYRIIKLLVGDNGNLFMVGDDDQSIFGFTGADPQGMLDFKVNFPDGIKLTMGTNYRSCPEIVDAANRFIMHNLKREKKPMYAHKTEKAKIWRAVCDEMPLGLRSLAMNAKAFREMATKEESETKNKPTLAILYRKNISALPIMAAFLHYRIPFVVKASKMESVFKHFREASVSKNLIDLLRLSQDMTNMNLLMKCYPALGLYLSSIQVHKASELHEHGTNVFDCLRDAVQETAPDMIGDLDDREAILNEIKEAHPYKAICEIMNHFDYTERIRGTSQWFSIYTLLSMALYAENIQRLLDDIMNLGNNHTEDESIILTTMHSSKGQQYRAVIIVDAIDDFIPGNMSVDDYSFDPEEERRIFYVALSRAEKELGILQYAKYFGHEYRISDYVEEYVNGNVTIEEKNIKNKEKRELKGPRKLYYAVRDGDEPKIYFDRKTAQEKGTVEICESLAEAEAYLYRHPEKLEFRSIINTLREEVDLPEDVSKGILRLFGIDDLSDLSYGMRSTIREKTRYLYCHQKEKIDYSNRANEYAFMYLPVNFYKMWTPLTDAVRERILPFESGSWDRIKVLELGPGPGTSTLSMLEFYYQLAEENDRDVWLDVTIVEYENAFIRVLKKMCGEYFGFESMVDREMQKGKLHCRMRFNQSDAIAFLHDKAPDGEYNLILESNMLNSYEHVDSEANIQLSNDIQRCLTNFGVVLLVEPADKRVDILADLTRKVEYTPRMRVIKPDQFKSTGLENIGLFNQAVKYKLRPESKGKHGFRYAIYQKR